MAEIIEMPKLSDTMSVGTIVSWLKKEGEAISSGDMIAEIETDKATMEMEVFTDGVLIKQYAKAGDQVAVGDPIAAIGDKGEAAPEVGSSSATPEAEPKAAEPEPKKDAPAPEPAAPAVEATPTPAPAPAPADTSDSRIKASPLAKKLASEKNVDLSTIQGTGPGGRIVKADIMAALESGTASAPASAPAASSSPESVPDMPLSGMPITEDKDVPVSNMRSVIASRLLQSKTEIPHFYLDIEVDMASLLDLRKGINAKTAELPPEQGGVKFSVNDFILKASVEALRKVPAANSSWQGTHIKHQGAVHLAFAVAVDDGLVTPTIKNAHLKGLRQISLEAKSLIKKAQTKKLKPDEMTGGTFTVTNLGMFGIYSFFGIINPPNAAILSVGATIRKPVVDAKGDIVPGDRMHIGISGDHRAIDGAVAAQYLSALKEVIENPAMMLI